MMGNEVVFDLLRGQHNGREGSLKILWRVGVPLKYIPSVTLSPVYYYRMHVLDLP